MESQKRRKTKMRKQQKKTGKSPGRDCWGVIRQMFPEKDWLMSANKLPLF